MSTKLSRKQEGIFVLCMIMSWTVSTQASQGTCRRTSVVAAKARTNGTALFFSTGPTSSPREFTLEIPGRFLPTLECGRNYTRCNILLIEKDPELLIFLPSRGGFVKVTHQYGHSPQYSFYPVEQNCHPVSLFHNHEQDRVLMECLNLTSETFYIAEFNLKRQTFQYSHRGQSTRDPSIAVYAKHKMFMVEDRKFLFVESSLSGSLQPHVAFLMAGCDHVRHMDVINDEFVYIYCNNQASWRVGVHAVQADPDSPQDMYTYPCVDSDMELYVKDGQLMFNKTGSGNLTVVDLPAADIVFGSCLGSGETLVFWGLTLDRLLFSVDLAGDEFTITNLSRCSEDGTCLRPAITQSKTFGTYFDSNTSLAHLVNFTSLCGNVNIPLPFEPDLLSTFLGSDEYNCSCLTIPTEVKDPSSVVTAVVVAVVIACIIGVISWRRSLLESSTPLPSFSFSQSSVTNDKCSLGSSDDERQATPVTLTEDLYPLNDDRDSAEVPLSDSEHSSAAVPGPSDTTDSSAAVPSPSDTTNSAAAVPGPSDTTDSAAAVPGPSDTTDSAAPTSASVPPSENSISSAGLFIPPSDVSRLAATIQTVAPKDDGRLDPSAHSYEEGEHVSAVPVVDNQQSHDSDVASSITLPVDPHAFNSKTVADNISRRTGEDARNRAASIQPHLP